MTDKEPVWTHQRKRRSRRKAKSPGPLFEQWPPPAAALPDLETLRELSKPKESPQVDGAGDDIVGDGRK